MIVGAAAWDEFQWEAHLRRLDRIADRLMEVQFYRPPHPFGTLPPCTWSAAFDGDGSVDPDDFSVDDYGWLSPAGRIVRMASECRLMAFQLTQNWTGRTRDASLIVEFLANVASVLAHFTRAAREEEEGEELGKGIALAKRSLTAANLALGALGELGRRRLYRSDDLRSFAEELTELRNEIALYVLDLRDRFRSAAS
jgi:hypothetical protein